jgi:hypothetical protein
MATDAFLFIQTLNLVILITLCIASYISFDLAKKLYGGKFTAAIPYIVTGTILLATIPLLDLIGNQLSITDVVSFSLGVSSLQVLAGIFFMSAMYRIYQIQFLTYGYVEENNE